jgi:hypothetical protein
LYPFALAFQSHHACFSRMLESKTMTILLRQGLS